MKAMFVAGLVVLQLGAAPAIGAAPPQEPSAPVASAREIVAGVKIPYQSFTLDNGLRVLVHTDRKAPVVAVSVWYNVGSKHEPKGESGFAHLFEHLMFGGSENADASFFEPMQQLGATNLNGTTSYDRTNYYETVPTGALEKTLYLESDRMGHLLGAITQAKLDNQRGVVQNEKRQRDNQPYGLVQYAQAAALFPADHPYGHPPIGSMADLDAASLDDVHGWFRQHYGPNNAVLVLAGDIDLATAKPLVERYFGPIKRGPDSSPIAVAFPTLPARKDETLQDRVATTRLYRTWVVPGLNDPDAVPLAIGASVLGGLASSRLDNVLVRDEKLAVSVSAGLQTFAQVSLFAVSAHVKPGVDPAVVARRLDAIIADLIAEGPTAGEVDRVAIQNAVDTIKSLESVGGKAGTLAEGLLYSNDPDHYAQDLDAYAAATPATVKAALGQWLSRPVYALTVTPGARPADREAQAVTKASKPASAVSQTQVPVVKRAPAPAVGEIADLTVPPVTRARLSNGIEVVYAQRRALPTTQVALSLDAGYAADPKAKRGTAALTTALLQEGTTTLSSLGIAERQETLGASITAGSSMDRTRITLSALTANLGPSLDLFADVALHPAFAPNEVDRGRTQMLARIAEEKTEPGTIAARYLAPALYGRDHPYGMPGTGDAQAVATMTRDDDLAEFHRAWFRPEKAKLFVVSDLPLATLQPLLEARFGTWNGTGPAGTKRFDIPTPAPRPRIVLVDRKDSPQSLITAAVVLAVKGTDDTLALESAAEVVGGSFLSRINMDLREEKGWSYGVWAELEQVRDRMTYTISAPVQADKTGAAIAALLADHQAFLTGKGVTAEELERTRSGMIRALPGAFETAGAVLGAMQENDRLGRPDDYYQQLPTRVRALDPERLDAAMRGTVDPARMTWVVVGDAASVQPQLESLALPVEVVAAP